MDCRFSGRKFANHLGHNKKNNRIRKHQKYNNQLQAVLNKTNQMISLLPTHVYRRFWHSKYFKRIRGHTTKLI